MRNEYKIKSDRDNYSHTFRQLKLDDGRLLPLYELLPAEEWMTTSVGVVDSDVEFVDPTGGPCIGRGWSNGEVIVNDIMLFDNYIFFSLYEH